MSHNPTEHTTHPEELLPWFVNGTLSVEERVEVEQHVESCVQCQQEIALLQKIRTEVKDTPVQSPGEFGLNRLLNEVRHKQKGVGVTPQTQSRGWQTGLAIAASLMIFVQAGLLFDAWFLSKPMSPLAGPQKDGVVLQVTFEPTTTEAQIRELMTDIQATFIDGPSSLGLYRIRLDSIASSQSSVHDTIKQLRQHTDIIHHVARDD